MRIQDTIPAIRRLPRRKTVQGSTRAKLYGDNDNAKPQFRDVLPPEQDVFQGPDEGDFWVRHSSEYVAQFIHQELLPDGVAVSQARQVSQKYQQANQNLQDRPRFAKISV